MLLFALTLRVQMELQNEYNFFFHLINILLKWKIRQNNLIEKSVKTLNHDDF